MVLTGNELTESNSCKFVSLVQKCNSIREKLFSRRFGQGSSRTRREEGKRGQVFILDTYEFWSAPLTCIANPFLPFPIGLSQINVSHCSDWLKRKSTLLDHLLKQGSWNLEMDGRDQTPSIGMTLIYPPQPYQRITGNREKAEPLLKKVWLSLLLW